MLCYRLPHYSLLSLRLICRQLNTSRYTYKWIFMKKPLKEQRGAAHFLNTSFVVPIGVALMCILSLLINPFVGMRKLASKTVMLGLIQRLPCFKSTLSKLILIKIFNYFKINNMLPCIILINVIVLHYTSTYLSVLLSYLPGGGIFTQVLKLGLSLSPS